MALEEWKLRLTSAKVEVEVEAELGKKCSTTDYFYKQWIIINYITEIQGWTEYKSLLLNEDILKKKDDLKHKNNFKNED